MADFRFLRDPSTGKYVISDPNRARRPNIGHKTEKICPFCIGLERDEKELFRIGGREYDQNWHIRVINNKYPFAPIHELIIHSPDHHKNFEELSLSHVELIFKTYRERYNEHRGKGQIYIFHNRGIGGGESIPHPHTQLTVIPKDIRMEIPHLDNKIYQAWEDKYQISNIKYQKHISKIKNIRDGLIKSIFRETAVHESFSGVDFIDTGEFRIFCPVTSQWPDEIWIAPAMRDKFFGDITDKEVTDLAYCLQRIVAIFDLRLGHEFPYNFYIYPGKSWYLRIIPRMKILGGFEAGTGIIVNTQDPLKTFEFVKEHFFEPDLYKIRMAEREDYWISV